ncbi:MAG: anaerobic ribonucleoside-triphosphate reductase activating protein, partial [Prevotellaceae bacterium]|nr:anaerobic ribonucleoside-triphosphate reductase activating protein [Prevotellaceae bacterium]
MLRFVSYSIVFQEIPDEVTLAVNISGCPHRCKGCHSPYLWEDVGTPLDENALSGLLSKYGDAITCICFMGGDANPQHVADLAALARAKTGGGIKTGWYSGRNTLPEKSFAQYFDYIKVGAYVESLGGLSVAATN